MERIVAQINSLGLGEEEEEEEMMKVSGHGMGGQYQNEKYDESRGVCPRNMLGYVSFTVNQPKDG